MPRRGTARRALAAARIEILPEPSPEERLAILLALGQVLNQGDEETGQSVPAWAAAGRDEALPGRMTKTRDGWRRGVGRLTAW